MTTMNRKLSLLILATDAQAAPTERSEEPASAMPNPGSILRGIFGR